MAESKSKKLKRFINTRHKTRLKAIQLAVKLETSRYLTWEQRVAIRKQITNLENKIHMYDRKIKDLEVAIYEKR